MKTRMNICTIIACGLLLAHFAVCQGTNSTNTTEDSTSQSSTSGTETSPKELTTSVETNNKTVPTTPTENSTVTESTVSITTPGNTTDNSTTTHLTTPITTTTPEPPKNTWEVKDANDTVCLLVQLSATFHSDNYPNGDVKLENATEVEGESGCGNVSQKLTVKWGENKLLLEFERSSDEKQYKLKELEYTNNTDVHSSNDTGLSAHAGKSYKCNSAVTKKLTGDVTVTLDDIQFQAFMEKSDKGKFGTAEECSSDTTSDVVPIAVGCALAGLVIVVLIAYLVGRRRSRQRGYQSV